MEADGITIALGATTTGFVVKELIAWLRGRNQRTEISPDPLNVRNEKKPVVMTVGECNRRMCEQNERITRLEGEMRDGNDAILRKLDEVDTRAEERAQQTHRRLDPFIEKVAANSEAIDNIKQLAFNATMGGWK